MTQTATWLHALIKSRGDRRWDLLIRTTGMFALLGIPLVLAFPRLVPLVWLAVFSLPTNSPLSPILPTAFEPVIMEAAKYQNAMWVTLVALTCYMYMEYLNWHAYAWVLGWERLASLRTRPWVRRSIASFARYPATTIMFFAFTPFPFWVARCLAILHRYPIRWFMWATAVGRFPRLFLYAWIGEKLRVPSVILLGVILGGAAVVIVPRLLRGQRVLADTAVDPGPAAGVEPAEPRDRDHLHKAEAAGG